MQHYVQDVKGLIKLSENQHISDSVFEDALCKGNQIYYKTEHMVVDPKALLRKVGDYKQCHRLAIP